jgi:hypothetical protein
MCRLNVWVLLSAAILSVVITGRPASAQQGQNSFPEAFRVIGNIYWVGGEYGSYLITTPQGHILLEPAAEKAGLAVMFLSVGEVPKFARIAERHPQLTLIIDHMGLNSSSRPNRVTENIPAAIDQAIELAKYPNVSIKLSGAVGNSLEPYPFRDTTVYLQRLFDAFGPQRCHWATDITNSLVKASYPQRVTHFTEELSFLSESDKDWVMGRAILTRLKWA